MSIEQQLLDALDPEEGTESFALQFCVRGNLRQVRNGLRRLARKELAQAERCPDGAWVWFRAPGEVDASARTLRRFVPPR